MTAEGLAVELMAAGLELSHAVAGLVNAAQTLVGVDGVVDLQREPSTWEGLPDDARLGARARIVGDPDTDPADVIAGATGVGP